MRTTPISLLWYNCVNRFLLLLAFSLLPGSVWLRGSSAEKPLVTLRDILTHHGDNSRIGWYNDETRLTPENVNPHLFGKIWERDLGGRVYGQPLFVHHVTIRGRQRNVIYAATMTNHVHAIDADTGEWLWPENVDPDDIDPRNHGVYLGPPDLLPESRDSDGPIGARSTMVIDRPSNTLYLVNIVNNRYLAQPPGSRDDKHFLLHALDLSAGREHTGWPVEIQGTYRESNFGARQANQRGALMLLNGRLYIPFGSLSDKGNYHGWLFSYSASDPTEPPQIFCASCPHVGSGMWGVGGPSADTDGNLYVVTGNGSAAPAGVQDLSMSVLRIATRPTLSFDPLPKNLYTPSNRSLMNRLDWDLGSSSAIVLPRQEGTSTPHLLFLGGKDGRAYLLNRDHLGGYGGPSMFSDESEDDNPDDAALKRLRLWGGSAFAGIRTVPAYFASTGGPHYLYITGANYRGQLELSGAKLVALRLTVDPSSGRSSFVQAWESAPFSTDTAPVVSSSGGEKGIVWVIDARKESLIHDATRDTSILNAYDALTGALLYTSKNGIITDSGVERDRLRDGRKFSTAIVRGGKVYVGTTGIVAYGLLDPNHGTKGHEAIAGTRDPENLALRVDAKAISSIVNPSGGGSLDPNVIRDGVWKFSTGVSGYTQFDTSNQTFQRTLYVGIRFPETHEFNEMDFQLGGDNDGRLFRNGGWFASGTTRLEVYDGTRWKEIPNVQWTGYRPGGPRSPEAPQTAPFGAPLKAFDIFKARFQTVSGYAIRIIGTPGQGGQSNVAFGSCSQIRLFNRQPSR